MLTGRLALVAIGQAARRLHAMGGSGDAAIELSDDDEDEDEDKDEDVDVDEEEDVDEDVDEDVEVHNGPPGKCSCSICIWPVPKVCAALTVD